MVFSKIIKKLQLPGEYTMAALESFGNGEVKLTTATAQLLSPGDIATFSYRGDSLLTSRRFLVVSTGRNPSGKFISSRGNYLICAYDLTAKETLPGLVMVFNSFYKKRKSTYETLEKFMSSLFGGSSFKTFDTKKMSSVFTLEISKEKSFKDKK